VTDRSARQLLVWNGIVVHVPRVPSLPRRGDRREGGDDVGATRGGERTPASAGGRGGARPGGGCRRRRV
jgi:hypothetical protein